MLEATRRGGSLIAFCSLYLLMASAEAIVSFKRVQTIAESGLSALPPQYIQHPDHRPNPPSLEPSAGGVPVINLDPRRGGENLVSEISRACRDWGAFQVINHGVPLPLLDEIRLAGTRFFGSPMEEKIKYACDKRSAATEGYGSQMLNDEPGVLDWRDYFDHHTLPLSRRDPSRWPHFIPGYRDSVVEYSKEMWELAQKLLSIISQGLGLYPTYMEEAVGEVFQNITFSYYSPCPQPELALGLQSHSDMGAITLLIQDDVGGLEVLKDDRWFTVKPQSDAIVVILGDQTEIISNGVYRSVEHRAVVNAKQARLSVAAFYDPAKTRKIFPASELIGVSAPVKYREVVYGDYVSTWYGKGPEGKRNIDALRIY